MPTSDATVPEIIRLQLRKPKSWHWELSTSKSSPHIILPVIQLYDYKGQLVAETADSGGTARKICKSDDVRNDAPGGRSGHLTRSRSDTLDHNFNKKSFLGYNSINRRDRKWQRNDFVKTPVESSEDLKRKPFSIGEKTAPSFPERNAIEENQRKDNGRGSNRLRKCQSDKCGLEGNSVSLDSNAAERSSLRSFPGSAEKSQTRRHRRSRSDDLFRRKLRYNKEESIKLSEMDGPSNFITPNIPEDGLQEHTYKNKTTGIRRVMQTADNVPLEHNTRNIEVNDIKQKKYTTRTSSAGTLIIPEESFRNAHRRRQRRDAADDDSGRPAASIGVMGRVDAERKTSARSTSSRDDPRTVFEEPRPRRREADKRHARQASDPTAFGRFGGGSASNRLNAVLEGADRPEKQRRHVSRKSPSSPTGAYLFYSHSDVFPFERILNGGKSTRIDECHRNGRNSSAEAAINSSGNRQNSGVITEKLKRKKRRRVRSRKSDGSTSSGTMEPGDRRKGHLIKEHSARRVKSSGPAAAEDSDGGNGASDLLQLVRRLSYTATATAAAKGGDDVKMGANVSRHSVKGLSGRRSQSSGSICNGSGGTSGKSSRHPDGKICGSLPNYLDDKEKNGACNNNHRAPLDEVDRIPPLGDGAPLHWKFSDTQTALCDQGYGSERSPEEEYPPPLPDHDHLQCHHHLEPHACYPFVTPDSTFLVKLMKGSRGLGLSVTGGIDSSGSWPGLIRIKRLFPHQPASSCGLLNVGDLLLEANGITLTGLTNYEALEVLRTSSNQVELRVCRPPPDVLNCVSPISEVPPPPPRREPPNSLNLPSAIYSTPEDEYYHGEFDITLTKIQGSLGFTLRKEDDSALGHYVRALVREPALTDGRIKAGDKIIAVNDVEICPMSHEQAVQFLRQCPEIVKLRLYRDSAQTPVATLSPSETTPRTSFSRKAPLRQEAVDMLNDIAGRKLVNVSQEIFSRSPNASPRRRRLPCSSDASQAEYDQYHEQFHEGLIQKCPHPFDEDAFNSLFSMDSEGGDRPPRPVSLDIYNPNQTPVAARKPRFNFSLAHNAYELNNLDAEVLDAPNLTYNLGNEEVKSTEPEGQEAVSMPHIPTNPTFSYKHPAYQSAHPQIGSELVEPGPSGRSTNKTDDGTLKRRRNTLQQEDVEVAPCQMTHPMPMKEEYEVLAIELNRGWNSRLGFSLQGAAGVTYVSAVYADSVAAKDGRLKPGDRLIKVNDESIEHMTTGEIINLLRIVRGPVCIVVSRVKSNEDCQKSNAEN